MIKFYYCLSSILLVGMVAGCGGAKEKEKEGSNAAKIVYVEEQNLVDTVVLRMQPFNKQIVDAVADIVPAAFVAIIELMDYLGRDSLVHTFHNIRYGLILSD